MKKVILVPLVCVAAFAQSGVTVDVSPHQPPSVAADPTIGATCAAPYDTLYQSQASGDVFTCPSGGANAHKWVRQGTSSAAAAVAGGQIIGASTTGSAAAQTEPFTAGSGGVTANTLCKMDANSNAIAVTTADTGAYGVCMATATVGNAVNVRRAGAAQILADGATVIGDMAIVSVTNNGYIHDSGLTRSASVPITQRIIGVIQSVASGSGQLATVELTPAHFGTQPSIPIVDHTAATTYTVVASDGGTLLTFKDSTAALTGIFAYASGGTVSGTGTCNAAASGAGGSGATGTFNATSGTITLSSVLTLTSGGTGYTTVPTQWTLSNGTATCSGTAVTSGGLLGAAVTLPLASAVGTGWQVQINNVGTLLVTITPTSPALINGITTYSLLANGPAVITSDGTNYRAMGGVTTSQANAMLNVMAYGAKGDGATDDTIAIQAAINDATAKNSVYFPAKIFLYSTLTMKTGVRLRGAGVDQTILKTTSATGNTLDFTGVSFSGLQDMTISTTVQRTAGALVYVDNGTGSSQANVFRDLRLFSGFRGIQLNNTTATKLMNISPVDLNNTWVWHSAIDLSGTATSTDIYNVYGSIPSGFTCAAFCVEGSTVDTLTIIGTNIIAGVLASGGHGTIMAISSGQWISCTGCDMESGFVDDAMTISGGRGITFNAGHFLGFRGIHISGGNGIVINGADILVCQQGGILIDGTAAQVAINSPVISDISGASSGTYDAITVNSGATWVAITNPVVGRFLKNLSSPRYAINIGSGVTNYSIRNPMCVTCGTGVLSDSSGTNVTSTGSLIKGNSAGDFAAATLGTDYIGVAATLTQTGLTDNFASTNILASASLGIYKVGCYTAETAGAGTSSTLPQAQITWVDADSSITKSQNITNTNTGNVAGSVGATGNFYGVAYVRSKAAQPIKVLTTGYLSNPANTMSYNLYCKVTFEGN